MLHAYFKSHKFAQRFQGNLSAPAQLDMVNNLKLICITYCSHRYVQPKYFLPFPCPRSQENTSGKNKSTASLPFHRKGLWRCCHIRTLHLIKFEVLLPTRHKLLRDVQLFACEKVTFPPIFFLGNYFLNHAIMLCFITWPSPSTPSPRPRRGRAPPSPRRAGAARGPSHRGPHPG